MKKYAIAIDVSPSEQIGDDNDSIFCLGILFALKSPASFNQVGSGFPGDEQKLTLRKYSGSSTAYRSALKAHLSAIRDLGHVWTGASIANQRYMKRMGLPVWERAHGKLPPPSSHNKKGKPRHRIGPYKNADGVTVEPYEVLENDLCIIGWLISEIAFVHKLICDINSDVVKLEVLMDRLPNDQGPEGTNKVELLKWTLNKLSDSIMDIAGIPAIPDNHQRDLLVDNIAGMCRDILESNRDNPVEEIRGLLGTTRFQLPEG